MFEAHRESAFRTLLWALLFAFAFTQAPLYYSNQHQYFVHGLAQGGLGHLNEDWLANTLDPTPIFSGFVANSYRIAGEATFYAAFLVLAGVYFIALRRIANDLLPNPYRRSTSTILTFSLLLIHAGLLRAGSVLATGVDYPWFFQSGIAGQYLLGNYLQPSAFGVLLLVSLVSFQRQRWIACCLFCCLPAIVHATYLLPAAFLTLGYQTCLVLERRWKLALKLGLGNLLLVLPVVIHYGITFEPTTMDDFSEAQRILAEIRIPHHAVVARWFDWLAALQIVWILLGLVCLRGSRYFVPLFVVSLLSLALSLVQIATGNRSLALLFPWRTTALLVPVATAAIFARATCFCDERILRRNVRWVQPLFVGLAILLASGSWAVLHFQLGYRQNDAEKPLLEFVRTHGEAGQVYLIPVNVPDPAKAKPGNISTTFTAPPRPGQIRLIAVDLQPFRLATGAPIYVDFKSVPYRDVEVAEWLKRVLRVQKWYARDDFGTLQWRVDVAANGITHAVVPANRAGQFGEIDPIYADEYYRVYELSK